MRRRTLGNPTDLAWLRGWDTALVGGGTGSNPYVRRPQREAWKAGHAACMLSDGPSVAQMKRRANKVRPGTYLEAA